VNLTRSRVQDPLKLESCDPLNILLIVIWMLKWPGFLCG
jgi:hypothetical protein